jgi:hypothetical protein
MANLKVWIAVASFTRGDRGGMVFEKQYVGIGSTAELATKAVVAELAADYKPEDWQLEEYDGDIEKFFKDGLDEEDYCHVYDPVETEVGPHTCSAFKFENPDVG